MNDMVGNSRLGKYPTLEWIALGQLHVDQTYQRSIEGKASQKLINAIAAEFMWARFIPLTVCAGDDDTYSVIDGQHRLMGARKRGGINKLPCYVISADSVQEQAAHFAALNENRVRMHTVDLYHARVAAGKPIAIKVQRLCTATGISICKAPFQTSKMPAGTTQAVGTLERAIERHSYEVVVRALTVLRTSYPDTPGQLRSRMIEAMIRLYAQNAAAGITIDDEYLQTILAENDAFDLEMGAKLQPALYNGDVAAGIVDALAEAYNENRESRPVIAGQISEE